MRFAVAIAVLGVSAAAMAPASAAPPASRAAAVHVAATADSTGGRTLTASKTDGLSDEVVQVSWTNFSPTTPISGKVIVVQCPETPTALNQCFTAQPFPALQNGNEVVDGTTQADGTGTTFFEVRPAALLPQLDCSATHPCSLMAYENQVVPDGQMPANYATVDLHFAPSVADCPPITTYNVRLEGEASAAPAAYQWAAARCTGAGASIIDYTETSAVLGRQDFLAGIVDGAVTSLPVTSAEIAAAKFRSKLVYAPVDLTAVVVAYNFRDPDTNQPITDLTLTPRLVARIITESDLSDFFSDPEFLRLNPGHRWPVNGLSNPLLRGEENDDTSIITGWIASNSRAEAFLNGADPEGIPVQPNFQGIKYPTNVFADVAQDSGYVPTEGEYRAAIRAFYGVRPADGYRTDPRQSGAVAVLDLPAAQEFGLPIAKLVNAAGVAVAPNPTSILAGFADMHNNPDGTHTPNLTTTDAAAYPLVKVDHLVLSPAMRTAALAASTKAFLDYAATTGQTGLPEGYVPLPSSLVAQTTAVAAELKGPAATTPAPTATTPSPTVPLDTTPGAACCSSVGGDGVGSVDSTSPAGTGGTSPTTVGPHTTTPRSAVRTSATLAASGARLALPLLLLLALLALVMCALPLLERPRAALAARKAARATPASEPAS